MPQRDCIPGTSFGKRLVECGGAAGAFKFRYSVLKLKDRSADQIAFNGLAQRIHVFADSTAPLRRGRHPVPHRLVCEENISLASAGHCLPWRGKLRL